MAADLQLASWPDDPAPLPEQFGCEAVLVTAQAPVRQLERALTEWQLRGTDFPVLVIGGLMELRSWADRVRRYSLGVVCSDLPELLAATLEREITSARAVRREQPIAAPAILEAALAATPVGVAIADASGVLRWANRAFCGLAGVELAAVEDGAARLWPADDARWRELRETIRRGQPWRGVEMAGAASSTVERLVIAPVEFWGAEPWLVVVRQTGPELAEAAGQWAAAQRHELFAAIAGGIAHDLNNILAPITMAANILGEQELSAANAELVHTIEHSAARGAAVIRQVLTFARGSDNCDLVFQPRFLLREVARLAAEVFPPHVGVRAELPTVLGTIRGDPAEIHQALINVLLNARDALPDGGHIAIVARDVTMADVPASPFFAAEPGEYVEISVSDTGPGPDPELAGRAWEPFVTTKGGGQGAGLGLARVAGVLRSHDGFGVLRRAAGGGTTVSLYFPRAPEAAASVREAEPEPADTGGRILVVDDESEILSLCRQILERAGHEVLVASDGREALGLFMRQRTEIGLVLTDLAMPGMNGFTLLWALRRAKPDLRVMVATGQGTDANLRELEQMGVREVLLKPYTAKALLAAVARALAEPVRCEPDLYLDSGVGGPASAA